MLAEVPAGDDAHPSPADAAAASHDDEQHHRDADDEDAPLPMPPRGEGGSSSRGGVWVEPVSADEALLRLLVCWDLEGNPVSPHDWIALYDQGTCHLSPLSSISSTVSHG
ncbi:uncharacterized protein LOC124159682 [Ischnura elegans]|uniref:uncharacterized protein LOC124159682 n=1 Tax=Ischnura elegans TaxID=197161 RepID=UPI001ED8B872|nr:uncharacterized protein LOC124159682 [Ischnura elegans]